MMVVIIVMSCCPSSYLHVMLLSSRHANGIKNFSYL